MTFLIDGWLKERGFLSSLRYGTAIISTILAIWMRMLLHPYLAEQCQFSLFYLSVLLTAWVAGTGPAILAIVLGTFSAAYFFDLPASSIYIENAADAVQLTIYVLVNCIATFLFARIERQRRDAENRSAENELLSNSLREADEKKDEFLALLAHELRNPLAPIRTSLALLERHDDSRDVIHRVRHIIQRQTNNLVRITDDLLDVSRFSRGRVQLQIRQIDLRDCIRDAVELTDTLMKDKSHRFQILVPPEPVVVNGDSVRLAQLISNLLSNSAKYTPDGGRISLQLEVIGESSVLSVNDNGIGFPPELTQKILEPFVQVDTSPTREYGGLGMGLTIVSRLVALHQGILQGASRGPGLGSSFTVYLPLVAPLDQCISESAPEEVIENDIHRRSTSAASDGHSSAYGSDVARLKILLVEDNRDAGVLLKELLESEGYDVIWAPDGVAALQEVTSFQPDLVIMDIGLPGMDGYETARRMRRLRVTATTKLIALTGWGAETDRNLAKEAGFDVHLIKPINFNELLDNIQAGSPVELSQQLVSSVVGNVK